MLEDSPLYQRLVRFLRPLPNDVRRWTFLPGRERRVSSRGLQGYLNEEDA